MAVPLSVKRTSSSATGVPVRLIVNVPVVRLFSVAVASLATTLTFGSSSAMFAVARRRALSMRYPLPAASVRITVSIGSETASSIGVITIVAVSDPDGIVTDPGRATKSLPLVAVPETVYSTVTGCALLPVRVTR